MTKIQGTIHRASGPREFNGVMQVGFILKGYPGQWYNVQGEELALNEMKEGILQKGAEISFEYDEKTKKMGEITLISLPKAGQGQEGSWADDMTSFEELLDSAHEKFGDNMHIRTEIVKDGNGVLQIDYVKKMVVFKAQVYIRRDDKNTQVFEGHGDAEGITNELIKPHWIRMAETRAISRALRFATNNAAVAVEETSGEEKKEAKKDGKPNKQ